MATLASQPLVQRIQPVDPAHLVGDKIQPGHPLFGIIWIKPDRVGGAPCFYATRVPVQNLFDSVAAGQTLDDFLDGFEGVSREQALAVLHLAAQAFISELGRM